MTINQLDLKEIHLIELSKIAQEEANGGVAWFAVIAAVLGAASAVTTLYDFGYNYATRHLK